jgi:hypothetical protein
VTQTIQEILLDMYRGDTQKFDVGPGALAGGFNAGSDVVKFTAKRTSDGPTVIALTSPGDIAIQSTTNARVTISAALTAAFPHERVELKLGVEVVRGSEKFTLASGTMIVKPVVRQ